MKIGALMGGSPFYVGRPVVEADVGVRARRETPETADTAGRNRRSDLRTVVMMLVGLLWLTWPFVLMGVVSQRPVALSFLTRIYPAGLVTGVVGAAAMVFGVFVLRGRIGLVLYFVGAPLCGLLVFSRRPYRDDGDDGGGDDGGGGDDHPEGGEDGPPFDWPEFERAFWAHVTRKPQPVTQR